MHRFRNQLIKAVLLVVVISIVPKSGQAQPTQYANMFTHFQEKMVDGRPFMDSLSGDFWDCMTMNLFGNTESRAQVEDVFRGNSDVDESFFNAAKTCGFLYYAAPFRHSFSSETVDLGLPISYTTPGITAQPSPFGRPPGIETIADPSAVRLPDGRIALFFSGDHREAFQSTRWVTKEPILSHTQDFQFELEQDYSLSERLLWRHLSRESDGSWTAFGDLDGFKKWTSSDGLDWQESSDVITLSPLPGEVRASLNLFPNRFQFDSFISMERVEDSKWIGVIPHYREGLDAEIPDPNGNGYDDPPYVLIYSSTDRLNWTYESHIIGAAEGFVEKLGPDLYAFSLYDAVLLSTDLKQWGFGIESHFTTRGIQLEDGYTITFGTRSGDGIPTYAHRIEVDFEAIPPFYTAPATFDNLPTLNQINGTNVAVEQAEDQIQPGGIEVVSLYPNPVLSSTRIQLRLEESTQMEVSLYNLLGQKVKEWPRQYVLKGLHDVDLSLDNLNSGLYTVVFETNSGAASRHILVIR